MTERADREARRGTLSTARRWFASLGSRMGDADRQKPEHGRAPIVMVAIDLKQADAELDRTLQDAVQRLVQTAPGARLACVTVMRVSRIGIDPTLDLQGQSRHVKRLIALRHWARSLDLPDHRITFHVLESHEIADALIDYARGNAIDHLIMGARGVTGVRRILGSVSSRVVAEANCTVTVVRARGAESIAREPAESGVSYGPR